MERVCYYYRNLLNFDIRGSRMRLRALNRFLSRSYFRFIFACNAVYVRVPLYQLDIGLLGSPCK